jgi:hypothetical protein
MNAKQIIAQIQKANLSKEDLLAVNHYVCEVLKADRRIKNAAAKATLEIGMTVRVNHPKLAGKTFELTEIRRTKAGVRPHGAMFGGYNVPLSLVEQV